MRVWTLEWTPEYESTTRKGIYATPLVAWDDLFEQVEQHVFKHDVNFSIYVGGDPEGDASDLSRPIVLLIHVRGGDEIRLAGESVKGTKGHQGTPDLADWRNLQQVGALIRQHAVQVAGYRCIDPNPETLQTGRWNFARQD